MPSGVSHILLSRYLPAWENRPFYKQGANTRYFQIGSIALDPPTQVRLNVDFTRSQHFSMC